MKKKLLFLIAAALIMLAGCTGKEEMKAKSYASGETAVKSITVDVADRRVEITESEDDQVHMDYFEGGNELLHITLAEGGELKCSLSKTAEIIASKPAEEYRVINLRLPAGIGKLTVKTTNEEIKIDGIAAEESISLETNGGDILCSRAGVGSEISLSAKNGDISGTVVGGWDDFSIDCRIKKGESNLPEQKSGGSKTFKADCNNGDINIEFVK